jgi:hypothetical protein
MNVEIELSTTHLGCKTITRTTETADRLDADVILIGPVEILSIAPDWRDDRGREWPQTHCEGAGRAVWADPRRRDRLA